jgi:hypothetical protein
MTWIEAAGYVASAFVRLPTLCATGNPQPSRIVTALKSEALLMTMRVVPFGLALLLSVTDARVSHANCGALQALAQQHAYDMARRNSLDHAGFMRHRGPAGARAENVAVGCQSEECARRVWMNSPGHRANMMRGGCQAVASAVSASGRRYWVMEIGGGGVNVDDRAVSTTP